MEFSRGCVAINEYFTDWNGSGLKTSVNDVLLYIDGVVQERYNSIALAMELCLSCTDPLIYSVENQMCLAFIFIVAAKVNN